MGTGGLIVLGLLLQIFGRSYFWRGDGFYIQEMPMTPPPQYYYPDYNAYPCQNCSPVNTATMSPHVKGSYDDYSARYNAGQNTSKKFNEAPDALK
ncbi:MAG: hypothetical protein Q8P84_03565 [Deltaproteobacteria bacterium]|nr:hypothetical protein [Deltaproteobacteria bacterium]